MKKLNASHRILMGFTMFSMFFGAGNLIFPSMLGFSAGKNTIPAFIGLLLTAVLLPLLAVYACSRHGDMIGLGSLIHPVFGKALAFTVVLLIGPLVAIPRTCTTSFEMAVRPFLGENTKPILLLYAAAFFVLSALAARRPDTLRNLLGKIMTPILLILIGAVFVAALVLIPHLISEPHTASYQNTPFLAGFQEGYQTMDALAGLNFGLIIAANIRNLGVSDEKSVQKECIRAMVTAAILLCIVYGALAFTGACMSGNTSLSGDELTGADVLRTVIDLCYGKAGLAVNGIIFFIACFDVCTGLLSSCSSYFAEIFPKVGFEKWLVIFTVTSFLISSIGLYQILSFSSVILQILYPVTIVVVILGLIRPAKQGTAA